MQRIINVLTFILVCWMVIFFSFCQKRNVQIESNRTSLVCGEECDTCPNNFSFHLIPDNFRAYCYETSLEFCTPNGDTIISGRANSSSNSISTGFENVCSGTDLIYKVWKNPATDSTFQVCDTLDCLDATVWLGATLGDSGYFGTLCTELFVNDTLCFNIGSIECCQGSTINCVFQVDSTFLDSMICCGAESLKLIDEADIMKRLEQVKD